MKQERNIFWGKQQKKKIGSPQKPGVENACNPSMWDRGEKIHLYPYVHDRGIPQDLLGYLFAS